MKSNPIRHATVQYLADRGILVLYLVRAINNGDIFDMSDDDDVEDTSWNIIDTGVGWNDTPEGWTYWRQLHKRFCNQFSVIDSHE